MNSSYSEALTLEIVAVRCLMGWKGPFQPHNLASESSLAISKHPYTQSISHATLQLSIDFPITSFLIIQQNYEMPERERRQAAASSTTNRTTGVRRNLFHQHLSRRPTTSSTSTSAETLRLDIEPDSDTSEIVIRDKNGEFEIGDPPMQSFEEQE